MYTYSSSNYVLLCSMYNYVPIILPYFSIAIYVVIIREASSKGSQNVRKHFKRDWHHKKGTCGELQKILTINNSKLQRQFNSYLSVCLDPSVVFDYYHGTSLKCSIYDNITLCSADTCGVCSITRNGFLKKFIATHSFQRFGKAFYFATNSSKSHDYTEKHDEYHAMLLCKVAVGRAYVTKYNRRDLHTAPSGYDSVHGQAGGTLNYDEIAIYNPEAILPTHILLYTRE